MEEEKKAPDLEVGDMNNVVNEAPQEEESLADSIRVVSPGRLVMKRFFRSRLSMVGVVTIIVLFLFSFLGPLFSPWGEIEQDSSVPAEKRETYVRTVYTETIDPALIFVNWEDDTIIPSNKKVIETLGLQPGVEYDEATRLGSYESYGKTVYFIVDTGSSSAVYVRENAESTRAQQFVCIEYTWDHKTFNALGKIDSKHWLGTDKNGFDVFVRLMYGGRISLTLGFVVVILETLLGILFGGLAGYFGKWVDQVIMRIVDIFNCVPQFPILLILSAVLDGMDIDQQFRIYYLMTIMTFLGWSGIARVVRGQILFLREQEYMIAAEALGLSTTRKIVKHLVPNIMPQLIVQMTLGLGGIILTESTLSYLGIGIPIPYAAWGTMIGVAKEPDILQNYPNLWVPAGILIVLAVLAFNFIGDGLRDAFDPKASR